MTPLYTWLSAAVSRFLRDNTPAPSPSPRDAGAVLGLMLVAALVLLGNHYLPPPLSRALAALSPDGLVADPQRVCWVLLTGVGYVLLPAVYCWLVMPGAFADLGLTRGHLRRSLAGGLLFAVLIVPVLALLSLLPDFQAIYPMARGNSADARSMLVWLLAYGLQFVGLEIFFRGFLILVPRRILGVWGLVVMVLPYTMIHFTKPPLEALGSIGFGLLLGILALRTRSVVDGIGLHLIVAGAMEGLGMLH